MGPQPEHQVPWILDLGLQALGAWGSGLQAAWGCRLGAQGSQLKSSQLQAAGCMCWGLGASAGGCRLQAQRSRLHGAGGRITMGG